MVKWWRRIWMLGAVLLLVANIWPVAANSLFSEPREWKSPLPFAAMITQGPGGHYSHNWGSWNLCAVDLAVDTGTPVLAPAAGRVVRTGFDKTGGGNFMVVEHDGRASLYLHLSQFVVSSGPVEQGRVIACSGIGGTGPHLHFSAMADASLQECISMVGIDGNTRLEAGNTFRSTNQIRGENPCTSPPKVTPAPTIPPSGQPPAAPSLRVPEDGARLSKDTPIAFEWNSVQGATQYYLEFWGGPYSTLNSGWQFSTLYAVGTLWPGTYFWRVRARNNAGISDWSPIWSFVIEDVAANRPPNPPVLYEPADWAVFQGNAAKLCAQSTGDPDGDEVQQYRFEIFESAQNWDSGWVTTNCVIPSGLGFFNYQWHAKVRDSRGAESPWSETRHFSLQAPQLASPRLRQPGNGTTLRTSTDVWLAWDYVDGAQEYYVEFWGGPYGTLSSGWMFDVAYHIGTMWPGTYYWHVKARGVQGQESPWSETWTFTIQQAPSPSPTSPPPTPQPTSTPPPPPPSPTATFQGNIAPQCARIPDGINSNYAFDGNLSTFWVDGLGHRFSLELRLPQPMPVSRILVWDRPQNSPDNNQINELIIRLSDGREGRFDMNSQGARCVDVSLSSSSTISSVFLIADNASGNNGLSEIEIWIGAKTSALTCPNHQVLP